MQNNQSSLRNNKFRIHSQCSVDSSQSASIRLRRTMYENISRTVFYSGSVGSTSGISHQSQARFHEERQENFLGFTFRTRWLLSKTKRYRTFSQNPRNTCNLINDYIIAYKHFPTLTSFQTAWVIASSSTTRNCSITEAFQRKKRRIKQ